jgi:PAS domain S-box-containing protein
MHDLVVTPPETPAGLRRARAPGRLRRYGVALAATAVALAISLALRDFLAPTVFLVVWSAVVVSAWYGGRGPALLTALAGAVSVNHLLLAPGGGGMAPSPANVVRLAFFVALSLLIGSMRESLDALRMQAEARAAEAVRAAARMEEQAEEAQALAEELEEQAVEAEALSAELEAANRLLREGLSAQLAEAQRIARLGSWQWEVEGDRVEWSDEMYRLYGLEPGSVAVSLETFLERVHPEDRGRLRAAVETSLRTGEAFELDHRTHLPGGGTRTLRARGAVERGPDGRVARMWGTGQDVTAEREAEEAARRLAAERAARAAAEAGRARVEGVLESLGEGFMALDREWRCTYANHHAERMLGRPRAELLGCMADDLLPGGEEAREALRRVMTTRRAAELETRVPGGGGWIAVRAYPWEDGLAVFWRDVTERRTAQEQRARLAAIVESSDDAILSKTLDGTILSWNGGAERLYGWSAREVVGRSVSLVIPPDRPGELPMLLERLARGEHIAGFETSRLRRDGSRVEVILTLSPLHGDGGEVVGASVIARDVTERRRAEAGLRYLAEVSRALATSLDSATLLATVARLSVPAVADFCAVYEVEDGRPRAVEVLHVEPVQAPLARAALDPLAARAAGTEPPGEPVLLAEVDGAARDGLAGGGEHRDLLDALAPVSLLLVPFRAGERVAGVLAFGSSVSGRRFSAATQALAEEVARRVGIAVENARLHAAEGVARRAAERAAEWIARLQATTAALSEARTVEEVASGALRQVMAPLEARAGWMGLVAPEGDAIERVGSLGFAPEVVAHFQRIPLDAPFPLSEAVRTGQVVCLESREEMERRFPSVPDWGQRTAYAAWAVAPMLVEGRPVGGLVLSFREPRTFGPETRGFLLAVARQAALALERARLFEAERRARAEAEAANRAKFDFLTTMSHELRTPLNAIAGYVELMEMEIRGPITPQQREDLGRIRRSQTHLLGLINDVLNFARVETGHVHFEIEDVPLDETLAGMEALVAPQVLAHGLTYEHRRSDPGATVRADRDKLRQIVLNLLSNAVKFTPPGGHVWLESEVVDGRAEVRVGDSGPGIPADKLATIFEPFVQVNAGYTRTSEGTGLGLAISRDLARAMGGDLGVESWPGEGSVFTLVLPAG